MDNIYDDVFNEFMKNIVELWKINYVELFYRGKNWWKKLELKLKLDSIKVLLVNLDLIIGNRFYSFVNYWLS